MSSHRIEWDVVATEFPDGGSTAEQFHFFLRYAILAPSAQNSQPWLFEVRDEFVDLYADRTRRLPVLDPLDRQLTISCGAALANLLIAMRRFGCPGETEFFPDAANQDLLVRVRVGSPKQPTQQTIDMFDAIVKRRTNRRPFSERPIGYQTADELSLAAELQGAHFVRMHPDQKLAAADLIAEGDRLQLQDRNFRRELSDWTAVSEDRRDGIPGTKKGYGSVTQLAAPLIIRTFDRGDQIAAKEHELATHSPILAALCTDRDDPAAWLSCGLALEDVLLVARSHGIDASYLNQPLERDELRPKFAELVGYKCPQLILRMGFGPDVRPTPRRHLDDVQRPG
jgi:nitroreductase